MKLTTPFTILNKKFNAMDLIRQTMKHEEFWDKECIDHPTSAHKKFIDLTFYIYPHRKEKKNQ